MFYKIINQYVDISYMIISFVKYQVPPVVVALHLPSRIDSFMYSFFPRAIRLWNHLPDHLVKTNNIDTFKTLLAM